MHLAIPVLESLQLVSTLPASGASDIAAGNVHLTTSSRKLSLHSRKNISKSSQARPGIDVVPFRKLGVPVPLSRKEALELAIEVLSAQRELLLVTSSRFRRLKFTLLIDGICFQTTLHLFRRPDFCGAFKENYLGSNTARTPDAERLPPVPDRPHPEEAEPSEPMTTNHWVTPLNLKTAWYFDNVSNSGVGSWRVLVSKSAERALREAYGGDKKTFRIRIKKIVYGLSLIPAFVRNLIYSNRVSLQIGSCPTGIFQVTITRGLPDQTPQFTYLRQS